MQGRYKILEILTLCMCNKSFLLEIFIDIVIGIQYKIENYYTSMKIFQVMKEYYLNKMKYV